MQPENPYQSPDTTVSTGPSVEADSLEYASFWIRLIALIIDMVALTILIMILGVALGVFLTTLGLGETQTILLSNVVSVVFGWLYFAKEESSERQATIGKKICGLKVVDLEGQRISFGRATGRFFGKSVSGLILYIGYIMALFTERKQTLHDMMAGCLVVKR